MAGCLSHFFLVRSMRALSVCFVLVFATLSRGELPFEGKMPEDVIPELGDVLDMALEKSKLVSSREFAEREALGRRVSARSAVLPKFSTSVAFRQEKDEEVVDDSSFEDRVVYNVVLRQPVYHWGALKSEKEIGQLQYDMELLNSGVSVSDFRQRVRRDYLGLVILKQNLERSRLNLDEAREKLRFQRESVAGGTASDVSVLPYELNVEREELAMLRVEADWEFKLSELADLIGSDRDELAGFVVGEIPQLEFLSLESIEALVSRFAAGVEQDEGYRRLQMELEVEKRRLKIVDQSLKPKFDAQLGLSSNALDLDGTRREQSYSYFGLAVAWNIFDGFRKKGRSMEALSRLARKEQDREGYESSLLRNFRLMKSRLELELRTLLIEERSLEATTGRRDFIAERVEEGLDPQSALTGVEKELTNLSIRTQGYRINYLVALSEIATELGLSSGARP